MSAKEFLGVPFDEVRVAGLWRVYIQDPKFIHIMLTWFRKSTPVFFAEVCTGKSFSEALILASTI